MAAWKLHIRPFWISPPSAGLIRPRDLDALGLPSVALTRLVRQGLLTRVGRGLYARPDRSVSEHGTLAEVARKHPQAIVCLLSALRVHDLTTQSPFEVWLAIPNKARAPKMDYPPLRILRISGPALTDGIDEHQIDGVTVRVTSVARTVADCFKFRNKIGLDVAMEALQEAWRAKRVSGRTLALCHAVPHGQCDAALHGKPVMNERNVAASVRARLLNRARETKQDFNLVITRYAIERLLYRISISRHADQFLLKGALLFDLWFDFPHRPTRDADFLGFGSAELPRIKAVFRKICTIETHDGVAFQPDTVHAAEIRKNANYAGVRVMLLAVIDGARCQIQQQDVIRQRVVENGGHDIRCQRGQVDHPADWVPVLSIKLRCSEIVRMDCR